MDTNLVNQDSIRSKPGPARETSLLTRKPMRRRSSSLGIGERQEYAEARVARLRGHLDIAFVLSHDSLHGVESQSGALAHGFGGKERLKDMCLYFRRNSWA